MCRATALVALTLLLGVSAWDMVELAEEDSAVTSTNITEPPRRLWDCPAGYVGPGQCRGLWSNCCGDAFPGANCGGGDCYCFQWICAMGMAESTDVMAQEASAVTSDGITEAMVELVEQDSAVTSKNITEPQVMVQEESTVTSKNITEPPRRLWECPAGYVGPGQCRGLWSNCCGDAFPGANCGGGDCYCFQWICALGMAEGTEVMAQEASAVTSDGITEAMVELVEQDSAVTSKNITEPQVMVQEESAVTSEKITQSTEATEHGWPHAGKQFLAPRANSR